MVQIAMLAPRDTHSAKELVEQKKEGKIEVETGLVLVIFPFQA